MADTTRGRRSKLTLERFNGLVADIRSGCYAEVPTQRAGIGERTYYLWLESGAKGLEPYAQLLQAIRYADAEAEAAAVARITGDLTVTTQLAEELEQRLLRGRQRHAEGK